MMEDKTKDPHTRSRRSTQNVTPTTHQKLPQPPDTPSNSVPNQDQDENHSSSVVTQRTSQIITPRRLLNMIKPSPDSQRSVATSTQGQPPPPRKKGGIVEDSDNESQGTQSKSRRKKPPPRKKSESKADTVTENTITEVR